MTIINAASGSRGRAFSHLDPHELDLSRGQEDARGSDVGHVAHLQEPVEVVEEEQVEEGPPPLRRLGVGEEFGEMAFFVAKQLVTALQTQNAFRLMYCAPCSKWQMHISF